MKGYKIIQPPVKKLILLLILPAMVIINFLVFRFLTDIQGAKAGYFTGMLFYWCSCIIIFFSLVTRRYRKILFSIKKLKSWQILLLAIPVILAFLYGPFQNRIQEATPLLIFLSLLYALANAFSEEVFWRGVYINHYPNNFLRAILVPSLWFGVWHYVPLTFQPGTINPFYFILSATGLGFCWAIVAYYTRSLFWSFISHALVDWSGIGLLFYLN